MNSKNQTVVRQGPNLKTVDETPAEHIMKNLDAYKGYTRYDMEQLVLNPSGYTLYDGNNRKVVYKKDGAEDITLLFRNGELKDAKITSSRKSIKSSQAKLHSDNMEDVRDRLENTVTQSSVSTIYDGEDCFITVTQKNYETGNESEWSFCVDFGTNKVRMLEPVEDEEGFISDNEVFRIIKNFLNGGMSREKRMNRVDYDSGEPIKVTGKGNKIGSSKKSIKSSDMKIRYTDKGRVYSDSLDTYVYKNVKYKGDTYEWNDYDCLYYNANGDEEDYLMITTDEGLPRNCTPIKNSRKVIKSGMGENGFGFFKIKDYARENNLDPNELLDMVNRYGSHFTLDDEKFIDELDWCKYHINQRRGVKSSRKTIKSSSEPSIMIYIRNPETGKWASQAWCNKYQKDPYYYDRAEIIDNPAGYPDEERVIYWDDDINDAICFSTPERAREYPLKGELYIAEDVPLFGVKLDTIQPLNNSYKLIKSSGMYDYYASKYPNAYDEIDRWLYDVHGGEKVTKSQFRDYLKTELHFNDGVIDDFCEMYEDTEIFSSRRPIKSAKTLCKKGSAKLIEYCEAGDYGYLGRYTIIIDGEEVFNFTAENRREAVCSFNNYLDHKINNHINNSRKPIKSSFTQDELNCLREMIVDGMDERFYDWYSEKYGDEPWKASNEQMAEWIKSDPEITKEYNDYLEREMPYYEPGHDEKYVNEFLKSSHKPIKSSTDHIEEYISSDSFAENEAFQDYIMDKLSQKGFSSEEIEFGWYDNPVKLAREEIEKNYSIDDYVNWAKDYITKDKYKMMRYKDWLMANGYPVE